MYRKRIYPQTEKNKDIPLQTAQAVCFFALYSDNEIL